VFVRIPMTESAVLQVAVVTPANNDDNGAADPDRVDLAFPGLNDDDMLASQDAEGYYNTGYTGADQPAISLLRDALADMSYGNGGLFAVMSGHGGRLALCARI
jgi:hypothetical protein